MSALNKHRQLCLERSKKFVCKACNKAYLYARGLQRHQKFCKKGRKLEDDSSSSDEEESEYEEEVDENVATCRECKMSFASAAGLAVHHQHCNKKVVYHEVAADGPNGQQGNIEGVKSKKKESRSLPLLQAKAECPECGKSFTSNTALSLHKRFFGENCNKTARRENETNRGQGERNGSEESGEDTKDKSYLTEKRSTVASAEEETQKIGGEDDVEGKNDSEALNKVENGKNIKEKEEQDPVAKDCPKETSTEAKVKMLVDYL